MFVRLPVVDNVIEQRFVLITYLMLGVMLAVILERCRRLSFGRSSGHAIAQRWWGAGVALVVCAVAVLPLVLSDAGVMPFRTQPVTLPSWFARTAPSLTGRQVVLAYPAPFSGIQSAMTWQAVNKMHYDQAGGGGPQGTAARAGVERPGFVVLADLAFGFSRPTGRPAEISAVRAALRGWRVTTVVVPDQPHLPASLRGNDPAYAAAFMTVALGRSPVVENGAWVWYGVNRTVPPLRVSPSDLASCDLSVTSTSRASMRTVPRCVQRIAAHS
jgi:hypothetical protein